MRKLYILGMILGMYATFSACNDEWKDELYTQMLSFKAPLGDNGLRVQRGKRILEYHLHLLAQRAHFLTAQLGDIVALEDDFAAGGLNQGSPSAFFRRR